MTEGFVEQPLALPGSANNLSNWFWISRLGKAKDFIERKRKKHCFTLTEALSVQFKQIFIYKNVFAESLID